MKVDRPAIVAAAAKLDPKIRLVLLYGADDSASRDLADRFARQFDDAGNPLSVDVIPANELTKDPARLAAAAANVSMFGDRTLVRVDGADEDALAAVAALLDGAPGGNPVIVVAGNLKKGSKLLARVETDPACLAHVSYPPQARDAAAAVEEIARDVGLTPARGAARALFEACGGDRLVLRRELEKLALYLDATPAAPLSFDLGDLAAIGADFNDADFLAIGGLVSNGNVAAVDVALTHFGSGTGIAILRQVARRFWQLLDLRAAVDGGASPESIVKSARPPIHYTQYDATAAALVTWRTPMIRSALARLLATERAIKRSGGAGDVLATQLLLGLATQARGRR